MQNPFPWELQTPTALREQQVGNSVPLIRIRAGIDPPPPAFVQEIQAQPVNVRNRNLILHQRIVEWRTLVQNVLFPDAIGPIPEPAQLNVMHAVQQGTINIYGETVRLDDNMEYPALTFANTVTVRIAGGRPIIRGECTPVQEVIQDGAVFRKTNRKYFVKYSNLIWVRDGIINPRLRRLLPPNANVHAVEDPVRELRILYYLQSMTSQHPNIIRYVNYSITPNALTLVLECAICDAWNWFKRPNICGNDEAMTTYLIPLLKQTASAIAFLHGHGIVHRDISANNIVLMSMQPVVFQIIDFGLAKGMNLIDQNQGLWNLLVMEQQQGRNFMVGKEQYCAPELAQAHNTLHPFRYYGPSIDAFSFGCVWLYCATVLDAENMLFHPNSANLTVERIDEVLAGPLPTCVVDWRQTLADLLHPLPAQRLLVSNLVRPGDPFAPPDEGI